MTTAAISAEVAALIELGQARRPWEYLRSVAEAGEEVAASAPVRFLLAANLGRLGFADAALELLDDLEGPDTHGLDCSALRASLAGPPATRIDVERQAANRASYLGMLVPDAVHRLELWVTDRGDALWREAGRFGGTDVARRTLDTLHGAGLEVDRVPSEHLSGQLICGLSTPFLLNELLRATRPLANGFTPRIIVVEPDRERASRALSMASLRTDTEEPDPSERIVLLTGEDAPEQLEHLLGESIECALPRHVLVEDAKRTELSQRVEQVLRESVELQRREIERSTVKIERECRTPAACIERIKAGDGLRVLLAVSRHSNFVRHSAADLGDALRSLGHEVHTLTEPDGHSTLSKLAYLRAYVSFDPDLVLLINHPRWRLGGALPDRAPSLCWVQDAMPHLFEDATGRQGRNDFLVGYGFPELCTRFGMREDRIIDAPLPVSAAKFRDVPVATKTSERLGCDVAFATRQSEPPEAMAARMARHSGSNESERRLIECTYEVLCRAFEAGEPKFLSSELEHIAREALADAGVPMADARTIDRACRLVVMPLADRMLRHRVAGWAAEICAARRWRFALFGSGWELHPTLGSFARGDLEHGEELRSSYQSAGVHLHASAHSLVHQRVGECLLSGGRVLCYRRHADVAERRWRLLSRLARDGSPDDHEPDGSPLFEGANHPEIAEHLRRWERFDLVEPQQRGTALRVDARYIGHFAALEHPPVDPALLEFGTALLDSASFGTRDQLEMMLERAIEHRAEFEEQLKPTRELAAGVCDAAAVVRRVLQTVAARL